MDGGEGTDWDRRWEGCVRRDEGRWARTRWRSTGSSVRSDRRIIVAGIVVDAVSNSEAPLLSSV